MSQPDQQPSSPPPSYDPPACRRCAKTICDPQDDFNQPLPGWPKLAKRITDHSVLEAFPLFRDLNIKSLLYYQVKLHDLRTDLHKREWKDRDKYAGLNFDTRADHLLLCKNKSGDEWEEVRQQYDLLDEIREVLEKYNTALIQYAQITALPKADSFNVKELRKWIEKQKLGGNRKIAGPGSESWGGLPSERAPSTKEILSQLLHLLLPRIIWSKKQEIDDLELIIPRSSQSVDSLTRWVSNELVPFTTNLGKWWNQVNFFDLEKAEDQSGRTGPIDSTPRTCSCKPEDAFIVYSGHRMLAFTSSVATVTACAFPIAAISVLSKIHSQGVVLGIIALFTVAFACGLMLLSGGARRVDVFTATAAFSAVMVVFVQNQNSGSCQPCPSIQT